jgi:hypothetical protein
MFEKNIEIALQAFKYFSEGWETGNFDNYFSLITDNFTFCFPEGKHAGEFSGEEGHLHMKGKCLNHSLAGERLKLHKPYRVTSGEHTVVLEFKAEGNLNGNYYLGNIAISLDILENKISGFREYYGFSS